MENGDIAVHGHEVYPSDVPSLGYPDGVPGGGTGGSLSLGNPVNQTAATEPPPAPGGGFVSGAAPGCSGAARDASRRMSSIVATAGVTAAARGVAAKTLRTGLRGLQLADRDVARGPARASRGIRATPTPAATRP